MAMHLQLIQIMTLFYSVLLLILALYFINCNGADPLGNLCNNQHQPINQPTTKNINNLLTELVSKASSSFYFTATSGQAQNKVFGLAQCRGDVSTDDCSGCLRDAAEQIVLDCPNKTDARIWYDYCILRYSKEDFIGKLDTSYGLFYYNVENVTVINAEDFNKKLGSLIDKIRSEAVVENYKGLGKGETKLTPLVTLYALAQCTRDLGVVDCAQCIAIAVGNFPNFCDNRKGCRAIYSNCYVRYELYPFFFPLDSSNHSSSLVGHRVVKVLS